MAASILRASGIYSIRNALNGKRYIGRAINLEKRKRRHFVMLAGGSHHSAKLQAAYRKYGPDAFIAETLLVCGPDDLEFYEQLLIDGFDSYRCGYNNCPTSGAPMAGKKTNAETRAKQSAALAGRPKAQDVRKKLSDALTGVKHSVERVEANRAAQTLRREEISERMRGNTNALGAVRSQESRAKYSASWTPERRAALSLRMKRMNPRGLGTNHGNTSKGSATSD